MYAVLDELSSADVMENSSMTSYKTKSCKMSGFNCVKVLLILINLLLVILGWTLIGLGAWLHISQESFFYDSLLYDTDNSPLFSHESIPIIFLVVGGFLTVVCFIGCCGIYAESVCFLGFYLVVLFFLVLTEIIVCSLTAAVKQPSWRRLLSNMQYQLHYEYNPTGKRPPGAVDLELWDQEELTAAWDTLQSRFSCCGALGPRDYMFSSWFNNTNDSEGLFIPSSCCVPLGGGASWGARLGGGANWEARDNSLCQIEAILNDNNNSEHLPNELYTQGCHPSLVLWIQRYERVAIGVLCFTLFLQLLDVLSVLVLMRLIRLKLAYYTSNDELYCDQRGDDNASLDLDLQPTEGVESNRDLTGEPTTPDNGSVVESEESNGEGEPADVEEDLEEGQEEEDVVVVEQEWGNDSEKQVKLT